MTTAIRPTTHRTFDTRATNLHNLDGMIERTMTVNDQNNNESYNGNDE